MMLTQVTAQNVRGDLLLLPLADSSGGYIVRNIDGLDPVKAVLASSSIAQVDGADFQHARRDIRNITMKIGIQPDWSVTDVGDLRKSLYAFFMPKSPVTMSFYLDDALFATTDVIVESCENSMFSADPEVDISLICYDPDFYDTALTTVSGSTVTDMTEQVITYAGSSDTGVVFKMTLPRNISDLMLYNTRPDGIINIFYAQGTFLSGDIIKIGSIEKDKYFRIVRAGLEYSVLYWMNRTSSWISLQEGDNRFRAVTSGTAISFTLEYTNKYGAL